MLVAAATFAWELLSVDDKNQLQEHNINDCELHPASPNDPALTHLKVLNLLHSRRNEPGKRGDLARRIYNSAAWEIATYVEDLFNQKRYIAERRKKLAHAVISEASMDEFLARRQAAFPLLATSLLVTNLFNHIRTMLRETGDL